MRTFKPNATQRKKLQEVATNLKDANALLAIATKSVEASKKHLAEWLHETHGLGLDTLKIGEMVQIEGVILIEIGSMNKFDEKAFLLADPEQHARFKKDFAVKRFKPLV